MTPAPPALLHLVSALILIGTAATAQQADRPKPRPTASDLVLSNAAEPGDWRVSEVIGTRIVVSPQLLVPGANVTADDLTEVGMVTEVIISPDSMVRSVIFEVGELLLFGGRTLAVPLSALTLVHREGDMDPVLALYGTEQELRTLRESAYEHGDGIIVP